MNQLYGFRVRASFESDQRWYDINAYYGRKTVVWSCLMIAIGVFAFIVPQSIIQKYSTLCFSGEIAGIVIPVAIPIIQTLVWIRRTSPPSAPPPIGK